MEGVKFSLAPFRVIVRRAREAVWLGEARLLGARAGDFQPLGNRGLSPVLHYPSHDDYGLRSARAGTCRFFLHVRTMAARWKF